MQPEEKRQTVAYKGKMNTDDILDFAKTESLPAVVPFTEAFSERIFGVGVAHHMLYVGKPEHLKASNPEFAAYTKVAEKLKKNRDFIYVSVDTEDEEAEPVVNFFEVEGMELPIIFGFQMEPGQKKFRCVLAPVCVHSFVHRRNVPSLATTRLSVPVRLKAIACRPG